MLFDIMRISFLEIEQVFIRNRLFVTAVTFFYVLLQLAYRGMQVNENIRLNPNLSESYLNLGRIWLFYKSDPVRAFNYLTAAKFYERNGALLPDIIWSFGKFYMTIEEFVLAEECFRQCIKLIPGNPGWLSAISWLYLRINASSSSPCSNKRLPDRGLAAT